MHCLCAQPNCAFFFIFFFATKFSALMLTLKKQKRGNQAQRNYPRLEPTLRYLPLMSPDNPHPSVPACGHLGAPRPPFPFAQALGRGGSEGFAGRPGAKLGGQRLTERAQVLLEILVGQHLPVPGEVDGHFGRRWGPDGRGAGGGSGYRSGPAGGQPGSARPPVGRWQLDSALAQSPREDPGQPSLLLPWRGAGAGCWRARFVPGPRPPSIRPSVSSSLEEEMGARAGRGGGRMLLYWPQLFGSCRIPSKTTDCSPSAAIDGGEPASLGGWSDEGKRPLYRPLSKAPRPWPGRWAPGKLGSSALGEKGGTLHIPSTAPGPPTLAPIKARLLLLESWPKKALWAVHAQVCDALALRKCKQLLTYCWSDSPAVT